MASFEVLWLRRSPWEERGSESMSWANGKRKSIFFLFLFLFFVFNFCGVLIWNIVLYGRKAMPL